MRFSQDGDHADIVVTHFGESQDSMNARIAPSMKARPSIPAPAQTLVNFLDILDAVQIAVGPFERVNRSHEGTVGSPRWTRRKC